MMEIITILGSVIYIFLSLKEIYHQGYRIFFQTLVTSLSITQVTSMYV